MGAAGSFINSSDGVVDISVDDEMLQSIVAREGRDNADLLSVFIPAYCALLADSPLSYMGLKPARVIRSFKRELGFFPIVDTITKYSSLSDRLMRNAYATGCDPSTGEFIAEMRETPIFREYHHWYRTGDAGLLTYVLSFLRFGKKLAYRSKALEATAFRSWLDVEKRLAHLELDEGLVSNLSDILRQILPDLRFDHFFPRFGGGRVAEPGLFASFDKFDNLRLDAKLGYLLRKERVFGKTRLDREKGFGGYLLDNLPRLEAGQTMPPARLKFVPKTVKTARSICMEPNARMFAQQGVMQEFYRAIDESILGTRVVLRDQTRNREACVHGSTYYSVDTIDLSAASDSVHVDLVRKVFPPQYLVWMLGTRTDQVSLPDGSTHALLKFAPMGSALCFPTQCIIFSGVVILAHLMHYYGVGPDASLPPRHYLSHVVEFINSHIFGRQDENTAFQRLYEDFRVYGDDIICDSRVTDHVTTLLSRLGFVVNDDKSFTGSQCFRESCGIYAYQGYDVTPLLFRIRSFKRALDAASFASWIDMINRSGDYGYRNLHRVLINRLKMTRIERLPRRSNLLIPFVTDRKTFGIYTKSVKPSVQTRIHPDWQVEERRVLALVGRKRIGPKNTDFDAYLHSEWWRARILSNIVPDFPGMTRIRPSETGVRAVWMRAE